jgi:hypothetical protein
MRRLKAVHSLNEHNVMRNQSSITQRYWAEVENYRVESSPRFQEIFENAGSFKLELYVDLDALIHSLAMKAIKNKSGKSGLAGGLVRVKKIV